jgi:hypothetical protein
MQIPGDVSLLADILFTFSSLEIEPIMMSFYLNEFATIGDLRAEVN